LALTNTINSTKRNFKKKCRGGNKKADRVEVRRHRGKLEITESK
jgi:hypothetical protein